MFRNGAFNFWNTNFNFSFYLETFWKSDFEDEIEETDETTTAPSAAVTEDREVPETSETTESTETTETTFDEQAAIDEWLAFLNGWWLGEYTSSNGTGPAKFDFISWTAGYTFSIEKDTGALVAETSGLTMRFYKVDEDSIVVKTDTSESAYTRTTEPTEEDKKTMAVFG